MWFRNIFILFLIALFASDFAIAQETPAKKDSTNFIRILNPIPNEASLPSLCTVWFLNRLPPVHQKRK